MHRFIFEEANRADDTVTLDADESHHALSVLRLKKGAEILLMDGQGGIFSAQIEDTQGQRAVAIITGELESAEPLAKVTLYQGLPKGNKLEIILQKCTELGIHAVVPALFSRCDKMPAKNEEKQLLRLRRIALEAAKQCGRGRVPEISAPVAVSALPPLLARHELLLLPWEEAQGVRIADVLTHSPAKDIGLIIGPEGGITPEEASALCAIGAHAVTLGPRILRTETAGMAALASILTCTGEL